MIESTNNPQKDYVGVDGALFMAVCRGKVSEGLDFEDNNKKHLANGDENEILLLLKNTADTLDNVLSKFSDLKDKHSTDSSKVIEAVEGAFK